MSLSMNDLKRGLFVSFRALWFTFCMVTDVSWLEFVEDACPICFSTEKLNRCPE